MTAPILQQGRQACLGMELAASAESAQPGGPVYLRDIARDLERALSRDPECAVHWIAVVDEPNSFGPPTRVWEYDDHMLQLGFAEGNSEGMLIYVHAQASRYKPAELVPLLRIKVLCGVERALREMQAIWAYLNDSPEFVRAKSRV